MTAGINAGMTALPCKCDITSWPRAAQKAVICACALLSMPLGPSVCKKEGDTILEAPKVGGHMMF